MICYFHESRSLSLTKITKFLLHFPSKFVCKVRISLEPLNWDTQKILFRLWFLQMDFHVALSLWKQLSKFRLTLLTVHYIQNATLFNIHSTLLFVVQMKHSYLQTDRQTNRQACRQACRKTVRQRDRQTDRSSSLFSEEIYMLAK